MEIKRSEEDKRMIILKSEEEFFSLVEQRYLEMGYEILETCRPAPQKSFDCITGNQLNEGTIRHAQRKTIVSLDLVYA